MSVEASNADERNAQGCTLRFLLRSFLGGAMLRYYLFCTVRF
jgi:hypothetical protein